MTQVMLILWTFAVGLCLLVVVALWKRPRWAKLSYDGRVWRWAWKRTRRWTREYVRAELALMVGSFVVTLLTTTTGTPH